MTADTVDVRVAATQIGHADNGMTGAFHLP